MMNNWSEHLILIICFIAEEPKEDQSTVENSQPANTGN
jgi:hypothetical protein